MTHNEELIAEARSFTAGGSAAGLISRLAEALETSDANVEAHAILWRSAEDEIDVLEARIRTLEATAQSHHFAAGSL